jgi:membrane associated rhomboid family serine protease
VNPSFSFLRHISYIIISILVLKGGGRLFLRTENFRTFIKLYPVVTFILAINIAVYLIYLIGFVLLKITPIGQLFAYGYGWNAAVVYGGEWWRLITPLFIHFQFQHILFNCFSIFLFAPALEVLLGKWKFTIAYFVSGILSNVLTLYFGPTDLRYLGSSGAIFGLFGIFLFIIFLRRHLIDRQSSQVIMIILIANLVWMFFFPTGIHVLGHLFGLLAGFVLGPILLFRTQSNWYRR